MNRHRANWSAMGPGFTNGKTTPTEQDFYELLKPLCSMNPHDAITNICNAVIKIKKENDQ